MCFRPPEAKAENTTVCPDCGASNGLDTAVCRKCGADLSGALKEAPPIVPPKSPAAVSAVIPGRYNLPRFAVDYPELPGASSIRTNLVGTSINDAALWRFLKKGVIARKELVDCWYSAPVTALIQDPATKTVVGVEIERAGKKLNIAARNGVIMALCGFENNEPLMQQAIDRPKVLPVGSLSNAGDGMRMARSAGAKMWHMGTWKSGGVGLAPEEDRMRSTGDGIAFFMKGSVILIGGDARRYIAEDLEQRHGRILVGGTWMMPARPDENYFVFDEAQRLAMENGSLPKPFPNWASDLAPEIESGKVVSSDTLWGVAEAFSLEPTVLKATVDAFNEAAETGVDVLGRKPENMRPFGEGPYYGVAVFPVVVNTQGGPERTAKAEIVDEDGVAIPHLYAAGEFGGITARCAQGGGNLSECIIFGKIAGEEAAAEKSDAFEPSSDKLLYGPGSGDPSAYESTPGGEGLSEGESIGVGEGLGGPLWVKVSSENDKVLSVEILRQSEYVGIGDVALATLADRIAQAGSVDVDMVAGATVTSMGLKGAVGNALSKGD